jgi:acetyltransferase-like isoleucine patch superfamily enzyme
MALLHRALRTVWSQLVLRRCDRVGPGAEVTGRVWVHGSGQVGLGARVRIEGAECPVELNAGPRGSIEIGDEVRIASGVSLEAQASIRIGRGCQLGRFCKIVDNNFHSTRGSHQIRPSSKPVVLEDDVIVGAGAIILPGAHLARGQRVPPGAVVRSAGSATQP